MIDEAAQDFLSLLMRHGRQVLDFELFRLLAAAHNTLLYTDGRVIDLADSNDTIVSQMTAMVAHFKNQRSVLRVQGFFGNRYCRCYCEPAVR